MVNERRPPPAWPLGWAPSCHTWVPLAPPPSKSAGRTGFFMSGFSEVASGSGQGVPFQGGLEGAFMGLGALGGIAAPWVWMEEGVTREGDWRVGRLCPCEICPPPRTSQDSLDAQTLECSSGGPSPQGRVPRPRELSVWPHVHRESGGGPGP